jgi:pimeloyl-ACP methyl ester carboxylesterase
MSMAPTFSTLRSQKSTNVRAKSGQDALKWLFSTWSAVAPHAAAWAAERLFMTPPRVAAPPHERAALHKARRFHVPFGPRDLTAWFWAGEADGEGAARPAVLLVHGWGGRAGQLAPIAEHLVRAGFSAVAFDAPAHGQSAGRVTNLVEFADGIGAVVGTFGPLVGTVGHSMGGAAAAIALGRGIRLGRLVTIGSPSDLLAQTRRFAAAVGLPEAARARMQRRIERRVGLPLSVFDIAAQSRPPAPVLVVHDQGDGEIPYQEGRRLAEAWSAELMSTQGLGHRRILRDPGVLARISGFMGADRVLARTFVLKRCATSGCQREAAAGSDVWEGWEGYCASCALELELRDRAHRARRGSFNGVPDRGERARSGHPTDRSG